MEEIKNESNEVAQPKEQVLMQIIITVDGQIKVHGAILNDRAASYGVLEVAKDAVRELHTPKVLRPQGNFLQSLRNGGKH